MRRSSERIKDIANKGRLKNTVTTLVFEVSVVRVACMSSHTREVVSKV
jgi:hypothetical protein